MRVLVTGGAGKLGGAVRRVLNERDHEVFAADVAEADDIHPLDITNFEATVELVRSLQPNLIIHAAAWTDVDGCAQNPERAIQINGLGTQHVALAARRVRAAMVYISTNEVFDGKNSRPYYEYDRTNPINPYGYSKWVGEQAMMTHNRRYYIVRTAWLFAQGGKNFVQAIINRAQTGQPLRVVTDEIANPTSTDDLADAIARLIVTKRYGVYHLVNEGACSRYDLARYILDHAGYPDVPIERISGSEWGRASTPPCYAAMHNLAGRMVGITLRSWQEAVSDFLSKGGLKTEG
jgi:dTDP-4-dehydrorhamnose reductase